MIILKKQLILLYKYSDYFHNNSKGNKRSFNFYINIKKFLHISEIMYLS